MAAVIGRASTTSPSWQTNIHCVDKQTLVPLAATGWPNLFEGVNHCMVLFTAILYLPGFPSPSPILPLLPSSSCNVSMLPLVCYISTVSAYTEASPEQSTDNWTYCSVLWSTQQLPRSCTDAGCFPLAKTIHADTLPPHPDLKRHSTQLHPVRVGLFGGLQSSPAIS
jgi:hypothetical protein